MRFDVITLFPELIEQYCSFSIMSRALKNKVIELNTVNPRDFTLDKHRHVDDTPYGGGAGMVLMCEPFFKAYESIEKLPNSQAIMLTPQGQTFNHKMSVELSKKSQLILLCGHYEGFDERIRQSLDVLEVSIGDFVLTGGELASLCLIDSISRNIEGALGKIESADYDSFSNGLLEYPQYTRPVEYRGMRVPDILLSGHHGDIEKWRLKQQLLRTYQRRPDLFELFLKKDDLTKLEKKVLDEVLKELEISF